MVIEDAHNGTCSKTSMTTMVTKDDQNGHVSCPNWSRGFRFLLRKGKGSVEKLREGMFWDEGKQMSGLFFIWRSKVVYSYIQKSPRTITLRHFQWLWLMKRRIIKEL